MLCLNRKKLFGSGGIRTYASEETGALNQRLRPLGHTTHDAIYPALSQFLAKQSLSKRQSFITVLKLLCDVFVRYQLVIKDYDTAYPDQCWVDIFNTGNISIFSFKKTRYFLFSVFPVPIRSILAVGISGPRRKNIENNNINTNKNINVFCSRQIFMYQ